MNNARRDAARRTAIRESVTALDQARNDLINITTAAVMDARDDIEMLTRLVILGKFSGRNGIRGHRLIPRTVPAPGLGIIPVPRLPHPSERRITAVTAQQQYGRRHVRP